MIPKKIHYCWFGGNPLPKSAVKCINSWKKYCPDYEIIEWNEKNFDIKSNEYIYQAYKMKKYAFVSDYARFDILFRYGGVYFDTDVELIKPIDNILHNGSFMACESDGSEENDIYPSVAPGLGIAAESGKELYKKIIDYYNTQEFVNINGEINQETVVLKTTKILIEEGLKKTSDIQKIGSIIIYPKRFFCPLDDNTGELKISEDTVAIHWFDKSWLPKSQRIKSKFTRPIHRLFGDDCFDFIKKKS